MVKCGQSIGNRSESILKIKFASQKNPNPHQCPVRLRQIQWVPLDYDGEERKTYFLKCTSWSAIYYLPNLHKTQSKSTIQTWQTSKNRRIEETTYRKKYQQKNRFYFLVCFLSSVDRPFCQWHIGNVPLNCTYSKRREAVFFVYFLCCYATTSRAIRTSRGRSTCSQTTRKKTRHRKFFYSYFRLGRLSPPVLSVSVLVLLAH